MKQKILFLLMITLGLGLLSSNAQATSATTLELQNTTGDTVQIKVTGEPNSTIRLSFLPSGASTVTTIVVGTTNSNGQFTTSISSGGYGIPAGSPAYATIDGVQSSMLLWPSYTSSISLSKTSTQIAIGQSVTITSSNTLILSANSLTSNISTVISGSQITITGLHAGTGTLILCGSNVGCGSVAVVVGDTTGQTQLSLSQTTTVLNYRESKSIAIFGGSNNGYIIKSNSNPSSVYATISGSSKEMSIFGNNAGTATIKICSVESDTNCIDLYVTSLGINTNSLTFSQNNLSLIPGLSQGVTVSGDSNDSYYISSNTNSGVATASVSGRTVTAVGGNVTGSTVITVCATSINATCSRLYVASNADATIPSSTVIAFSQNVVSVPKEGTANITVSGGDGSGYAISSNSNPAAVTASVNGNSNIISVYGNEEGSATVEVCSASSSASICASFYVTVKPATVPITFNKNNLSLEPNQSLIITITGGTNNNVIYSISNPDAASATLTSNGKIIIITGGTVAGTSIVTVCDEADKNDNCSDLSVKLITTAQSTTETTDTTSTDSSAPTQLQQIYNDAGLIYLKNIGNILMGTNATRNVNKETETNSKYLSSLTADEKNLSTDDSNRLNYFITYGTQSTKILGEGERAGVISSYKKAFGKLPKTETEWSDAIKIANGRWPSETSETALNIGKVEFKKVYKREANMSNTHDNAAVSVIAYGLRPSARKINSEKVAILSFKSIYGHNPVSALAWDIVRAIAYSGATR